MRLERSWLADATGAQASLPATPRLSAASGAAHLEIFAPREICAVSTLDREYNSAALTPLKDAAWQAGMPALQSRKSSFGW
jgi:hypothetical protein